MLGPYFLILETQHRPITIQIDLEHWTTISIQYDPQMVTTKKCLPCEEGIKQQYPTRMSNKLCQWFYR